MDYLFLLAAISACLAIDSTYHLGYKTGLSGNSDGISDLTKSLRILRKRETLILASSVYGFVSTGLFVALLCQRTPESDDATSAILGAILIPVVILVAPYLVGVRDRKNNPFDWEKEPGEK